MSYQATTWAIKQQAVSSPTTRHVLLVMANYAQPDGQDVYPSVDTLSKETGLSERSVRRAISELKEAGLIRHGNQKIVEAKDYPINKRPVVYDMDFSIVSPEDLGCHSVIPDEDGVPHSPLRGATQSNLGCHSGTQIVNIKKQQNSKTPLSPPRGKATKGTRLPDGWAPTMEMIEFAVDLGLRPYAVADRFHDYWIAVPGAKGVKLDWAATWRNWCRTEAKRGNHSQSQQTRAQRVRDAWAGVPDIEGV